MGNLGLLTRVKRAPAQRCCAAHTHSTSLSPGRSLPLPPSGFIRGAIEPEATLRLTPKTFLFDKRHGGRALNALLHPQGMPLSPRPPPPCSKPFRGKEEEEGRTGATGVFGKWARESVGTWKRLGVLHLPRTDNNSVVDKSLSW